MVGHTTMVCGSLMTHHADIFEISQNPDGGLEILKMATLEMEISTWQDLENCWRAGLDLEIQDAHKLELETRACRHLVKSRK